MATINLGNLTFTHKGDYAGGTAYVKNDVVYYATNGNSYIAKTSTTGNAPTSTAHWDLFVAGAGGIWNAGLSLGTAEQIVRVNSGATALEFADASGGYILQEKVGMYYGTQTSTFTNQTPEWLGSINSAYQTASSVSITPSSTSSKMEIYFQVPFGSDNYGAMLLYREIGGTGGYTQLTGGQHIGNGSGDPYMLWSAKYFDAPNTTSQIIYRIYAVNNDGTSWQVNNVGTIGSLSAGIILSVKEVDGSKLTIST